jgi:flagellar assembly protein FliH
MRTRVIEKNRAAGADRFDFPAVDPSAADALRGAAQGGAHLLTAGQLEALERQVKEEARKRGYEEGLTAGRAEAAARAARLEALAAAFSHPFQALERAVEDEIVALAVQLATHLVRREIEHDATIVRSAVADCLAVLAASARDVTVYFHPEDAALVRGHLDPAADARFKIAVDAALARGDLRVASGSSFVDGTLAARCAAIIAAARAEGGAQQ